MGPRVRRAAAAPAATKAIANPAAKPAAKKAATAVKAPSARQALKEKTNTTRAAATATERQDGSGDVFVKDSQRSHRAVKRTAQGSDELLMAGGLGPVDVASSTRSPLPGHREGQPASGGGTKEAPVPETAVANATALDASADGVSLSLTPSPPARLLRASLGPQAPGSVLRGGSGTPGAAMENSVLALRNFRRRPRQPSMLQMVQQRRASVQPSELGESVMGGYDDDADLDADLEARLEGDVEDESEPEDDFSPDIEGTPLLAGRSRPVLQPAVTGVQASATSRSSRKRTSDQAQLASPSLAFESSKSRRTAEAPDRHKTAGVDLDTTDDGVAEEALEVLVHVRDSPPPVISRSQRQTRRNGGDTDQSEVSIPSTDRAVARSRHDRTKDNSDADSVMAEPVSSSPAPATGTQGTDIMADPQSQYSPPPTRARRTNKPAKAISTSTLQSLLPKRRQTRRPLRYWSEFEFQSSDSGTAANVRASSPEEGVAGRPRHRRTKASLPHNENNVSARKNGGVRGRVALASKPGAKTGRRTYGRGATSDKENDDAGEGAEEEQSLLPDASLTMDEAAAGSTELAAARAKFAEVDDWEMEFESVSAGEGSSQTWR